MTDRSAEIREYLAHWGIVPTTVTPLRQHPSGFVFRANGDAGGDVYVILDSGPPAHFPVHFWDEGDPWRAVLRWYHGNLALIASEGDAAVSDSARKTAASRGALS